MRLAIPEAKRRAKRRTGRVAVGRGFALGAVPYRLLHLEETSAHLVFLFGRAGPVGRGGGGGVDAADEFRGVARLEEVEVEGFAEG